jgi:hypothetical protein
VPDPVDQLIQRASELLAEDEPAPLLRVVLQDGSRLVLPGRLLMVEDEEGELVMSPSLEAYGRRVALGPERADARRGRQRNLRTGLPPSPGGRAQRWSGCPSDQSLSESRIVER